MTTQTAVKTDRTDSPPAGVSQDRLDDLAHIIGAYNQVTEKLQDSHESLRKQVLKLQEELASTDAQLQRSKRLAALGEMAAGIAHEIRNPLAAIQLYTGMLADDLDPARAGAVELDLPRQTALRIASAVRGLNAIVTDVLSFAREIKPNINRASVSRLVDRTVTSYQPVMAEAAVTVQRLGGAGNGFSPTIEVAVDDGLIQQALLNLVRNAVDAMTDPTRVADAGPRVLTIDAKREDAWVVLTVRDTGPGIAEKDIDRIFNPFFTTRTIGTGLGLAIVHRIIDAHSGTISVHNDGGAVFELTLPIHSRAHRPVADQPLVDPPGHDRSRVEIPIERDGCTPPLVTQSPTRTLGGGP